LVWYRYFCIGLLRSHKWLGATSIFIIAMLFYVACYGLNKELIMLKKLIIILSVVGATSALADATVNMNFTAATGSGKAAGTIQVTETKYGLLFTPHLMGLTPGLHGFHVHVKADCSNNGMAAGGHFDPSNSGKHMGPYDDSGHLGDLPALYIAADGSATLPVVAPRLLHLSDINNHALMVHSGGDNYSDSPQPLGGGDGRMVCGIIKS
jgi:superoxide dismutase, Cu-Zn family